MRAVVNLLAASLAGCLATAPQEGKCVNKIVIEETPCTVIELHLDGGASTSICVTASEANESLRK